MKPLGQMIQHLVRIQAMLAFQSALPNIRLSPAQLFQRGCSPEIAGAIRLDLLPPPFHASAGPFEKLAIVSMPEAALDEHNSLVPRQHNVRSSG